MVKVSRKKVWLKVGERCSRKIDDGEVERGERHAIIIVFLAHGCFTIEWQTMEGIAR